MYVALDIETTGFDPQEDKVIEVAAVLFEKGKILKTFSKLVNPLKEIPEIVTHITGIKNDDIQNSPTLPEIQNELEQFIGDYPIVGHFISFDIDFLKSKGVKINNTSYDTNDLARLLLLNESSYSLETLTEKLHIDHKDKHRALDDTLACIDLFDYLLDKIEEIPQETLNRIKYYIKVANHPLKDIFDKATGSLFKHKAPKYDFEEGKEEKVELSKEDLLAVYNNEELLKSIHADYQKRDSQVEMSAAILDAFEYKHHYIIEAGTGTGKSMAYLLAAIFKALTDKEKVIIATHTKTLQEQLINKDVPEIKPIVEHLSKGQHELKVCTLKGKSNYLSKKRFEIFANSETLSPEEALFAAKIELWLLETQTGDKEELNLQREEQFMFLNVSCKDEDYFKNPEYKNGSFLLKARKRAQSADIVIVNHSLLAQDLKIGGGLLPSYEYLIIDEAHHLEESITKASVKYFSLDSSLKMIQEFAKTLKKSTQNLKSSLFISENEVRDIKDASEELDNMISKIEILFGLIGIFYKNQYTDNFTEQVIITEYHNSNSDWQKVRDAATLLNENLQKVLQVCAKLLGKDSNPEFSHNIANIQKLITLLDITSEWRENFEETFLKTDFNKYVTWILKTLDERLLVQQAMVDTGEELEVKLYSNKSSVILCSATLSTGDTFEYIRKRLHLGEHFEELILPSHFNYPDQVEIVIPNNIPDPKNHNYMTICLEHIEAAIRKFEGRTMVLFTSKKAVETSYLELAPKLKKHGFEIYAQSISGGKGKIIEKFRQQPEKRVIFGTNTFWEGVDIKGDDIKCVIIHKLPFDPPFDPVYLARSQHYMNAFMEYAIPRAIIRFKQGFGRLIRSESDTGTFMVLDGRVTGKEYGRLFIESLSEGIEIKDCL